MMTREVFVKNRNQLMRVTLLENGQPVQNLQLASRVLIQIRFPGGSFDIDRNAPIQAGVNYSKGSGLIEVNPGLLTEDQTALPTGQFPMWVTVFDTTNLQGVRFGGLDSDPSLMVTVYESG